MPNQPPRSSPVSVVGNHYLVPYGPYGREAQLFAWGVNPAPVNKYEPKRIYPEDEAQFKQEIQNRPMSDAVTRIIEELGSVTKALGMTGITWYEVPAKNLVTVGYRGRSESISFDEASLFPISIKKSVERVVSRLWESGLTKEDVTELARRKRLDPMKITISSTLNYKRLINYGKMTHQFVSIKALLDFFEDMQEQEVINEMLTIIGELKYAIRQYITLEYTNENGKLRAIPKLTYRKPGNPAISADVRIAMMAVPEAMTDAIQSVFRQGYISGTYPELAQYDNFSDMIEGGMVKPAEVGGGLPVSSPVTIPSAGSYSASVAPAQADGSSITAAEFLSLPESIQQKLMSSLPNQERIRLVNEVQKLRQSESTDMSKKIGKMGRKLGL